MKEAIFYKTLGSNTVQCLLCPHHCRLNIGEEGKCRVRINENGKLITKSYGVISAIHTDPIEKKPLYHFYPGKKILSIGSFGCNFHCDFCQNWEISQSFPTNHYKLRHANVDEIIEEAKHIKDNIGIAFTYNEPVINYEFVFELAVKAKESGLKTAMISNGFIAEKPLMQLLTYIDAFNIDLKVFSDDLYRKYSGGRLSPVLRNLKTIRNSNCHLEITHLVVTGMSDNTELFDDMLNWIVNELGEQTVLHLSRYFPNYRMNRPPTTPSLLKYMFGKAQQKLPYVYLGNIFLECSSDTSCHNCHSTVIKRYAYDVNTSGLDEKGNCSNCGQNIIQFI
ncbi:MAG: AmmeMemoRadiSam system radical SAM enzyme [Bacteroidales bacterium]